jgi:hypothetical protein
MYILYGVGAAAIVGGGFLYYLGRESGRELSVAPAIGTKGAWLSVHGSF